MTVILKNFEQVALQLPSILLIVAGIVLTGAGLCLWLGGLRWRIFTSVVLGFVAGLISSFFVSENKLLAAIFPAILVTCLLLIFKKRALVFIGAMTTTTVLMLSLATPASVPGASHSQMNLPSNINPNADIRTVISQLGLQSDFKIHTIIGDLTPTSIGIASVCGSLVMGIGLFFYRLASAWTCAIYGTGLIYAGMILLFLEKGSMPVQSICRKPVFYQTVAICMLIFGTFVGLVVCPAKKKKTVAVKDDVGEKK